VTAQIKFGRFRLQSNAVRNSSGIGDSCGARPVSVFRWVVALVHLVVLKQVVASTKRLVAVGMRAEVWFLVHMYRTNVSFEVLVSLEALEAALYRAHECAVLLKPIFRYYWNLSTPTLSRVFTMPRRM